MPAHGLTRWLLRVLGLAVALFVVIFALRQVSGAGEAVDVLSKVRPAYLVVGLLFEAAALLAYGLLTRTLLPPEYRPPLRTLLRIDLTSLGAGHVLPGGDATGSALRFRLFVQCGVDAREAAMAASVQSAGSAVVLNLVLWLALLVSIPLRGTNALYGTAAAVGVFAICLVTGLAVGVTRGQRHAVRLVRFVAARLPGQHADDAEILVRRVAVRLRELGRDRPRLVLAVTWAVANWLLDACALWVFVAAYGYLLAPDSLLVAFGLANVLAALPVTPGGLGIVEGVLIPTLVGFGAPPGVAVAGVLSYRLVAFWLPIPVSALTYLSLRAGPLRKDRGAEDGGPGDRGPDDRGRRD